MKNESIKNSEKYPKANYGSGRTKLVTGLTIFASIIFVPIVITVLAVLSLMMLGVDMLTFSSSTIPLLTVVYSLCILLLPLGLATVVAILLLRCSQLANTTVNYKKLICSLRREIIYLGVYLIVFFLCYYVIWFQTFMVTRFVGV